MKLEAWIGSVLMAGFFISPLIISLNTRARADDTPYIDELRKNLPDVESPGVGGESQQPYLDSIRNKLPPSETTGPGEQPYLDQLKKENTEKFPNPVEVPSYTEEQRAKLPAKESGGAIQALKEGRSELKPRFEGEIHYAFGMRYGMSPLRDITASAGTMLRPFEEVYGENYSPDLTFFYEYQLFHDEGFGSLGVLGSAGVSYFHGSGTFKVDLPKPWSTTTPQATFGLGSQTLFQFFSIPVTVAVDYRFNLLKYLRPFAAVGPTLIGYFETRNDNVSGSQGFSKGLYTAAGVSILLDWVSGQDSWDAYKNFGIRHSYLTVEYGRISTLSGDVNFSVSNILAGFTFEY